MENRRPTLTIAIPTKLSIHANTILSLLNTSTVLDYVIIIDILAGKSNIDQARSIMITKWYLTSKEDDIFMFLDSDQIFKIKDIESLIKLNSDVAVGVYSSQAGNAACRPKNIEKWLAGEDNDVYYGATGFMLIRKNILHKVRELIKKENGCDIFYVSYDSPNVIPFFKQRLIVSETIKADVPVPEWLGEDYSFCWMVRQVGGTIKSHISSTIGHEVPQTIYHYPPQYKRKVWNPKSIVYYLGNSRLTWSPSDIDAKGLGGSEAAVVYLTKEWTKLGYDVTVYGNVIPGKYNGVDYLRFDDYNRNDQFNILILWRLYGFSILPEVKAKKLYVDLHDKPSPQYDLLLQYYDKIDKIVVRSQFHKNCFTPNVHEKFALIENGLPSKYMSPNTINSVKKDKHKIIYASSYDRGLVEMLTWGFPYIKSHIPNAELHLYYGMSLLNKELKDLLTNLISQKGVVDHGMIPHNELMSVKQQAGIHYYLCTDHEVDCISIKESAVSGCIPVVSDQTVFSERDYVVKIYGNPKEKDVQLRAARKIVKLIKDDYAYNKALKKVNDHAIVKGEILTWSSVANKWVELFNNDTNIPKLENLSM